MREGELPFSVAVALAKEEAGAPLGEDHHAHPALIIRTTQGDSQR